MKNRVIVTHDGVREWAKHAAARIVGKGLPIILYGVPRGGVHAMAAVAAELSNARVSYSIAAVPEDATVFIDDIIDSGATRDRYFAEYPLAHFIALVEKPDSWVVFPWEGDEVGSASDIVTRLLQFVGEDPARGGLQETPARFLKAWRHYTSGYDKDPAEILKTFEDGAERCDEMVLVRDIPLYSHCEHHMAAIFGVAHVAYIPEGKIVGLSKLSRLVDIFARRLQVQERLTNQIADALEQHLNPAGVAVVLRCRHMCMESRGVCQQGHQTITSAMRGAFKDNIDTRAEFMGLIQ